MITVEERLRRIEVQLERIANIMDDMNRRQRTLDKEAKEKEALQEEVISYFLGESD